ncbi:MAG TPA: hypothetical protein VMF91_10340 [Bryobacteraceae bacterium]|nr:hypothetical protein [Bryobacteraceae bacterium]
MQPVTESLTGAIAGGIKLTAELATLCKRLFRKYPRKIRERSGVDRRRNEERRKDVKHRLRRGLWLEYHRVTESGKFDEMPRDLYTRGKLLAALVTEARRYRFHDRENQSEVSTSNALERVVDRIWPNPLSGVDGSGQSRAVYVIEAIAQELYDTYDVKIRDRRQGERRAAAVAAAAR